MEHKFLIHKLNHTFLLVDITEIGLPIEIYPPEGKMQLVPSLRFQGWNHVDKYLSDMGAERKATDTTELSLNKTGVAKL
jgi:hypothetical protein